MLAHGRGLRGRAHATRNSAAAGRMDDYAGIALYSGGTDSTLAPLLASERLDGAPILLLMVDLGEPAGAVEQARARAEVLGWPLEVVDGREPFSAAFLAEAIRMRADYWGYPLGTPLGRAFQCRVASDRLAALPAGGAAGRLLIHGCTARQNTRFRIERSCRPEAGVVACGPLTERVYSRAEKVALLEQFGIQTGPSDDVARDENIFCRGLEGDMLNTLADPETLGMYSLVAPLHRTPDEPGTVRLTFDQGVPVALDDEPLMLHQIIERCRDLGACHGIGRICVFEDTVPELGYKERSLFESPASRVIFPAHEYIEAAVLSKMERTVMRDVRFRWADLVYRGQWFCSERVELADIADPMVARTSGSVTLTLHSGTVTVRDAEIPQSRLLRPGALPGAY